MKSYAVFYIKNNEQKSEDFTSIEDALSFASKRDFQRINMYSDDHSDPVMIMTGSQEHNK